MLMELSKMEQRYDAVLGVVRDGFTVTEVARKFGVSRQTATYGSPVMKRADWTPWPIARIDPSVRRHRSRPASSHACSNCAGTTPAGDRSVSSTN